MYSQILEKLTEIVSRRKVNCSTPKRRSRYFSPGRIPYPPGPDTRLYSPGVCSLFALSCTPTDCDSQHVQQRTKIPPLPPPPEVTGDTRPRCRCRWCALSSLSTSKPGTPWCLSALGGNCVVRLFIKSWVRTSSGVARNLLDFFGGGR